MANITAKDVAELRAKTGIGMMDCKKALVEADGDMEAAIKILREKGELKAQTKMATRIAADGIVDILKKGDFTAMIEVNSETDFVAKNETFQAFVKELLNIIIDQKPADVDALMNCTYDAEMTVDGKLKEMIFKIGEKITIRRFAVVEGITSTYIHGAGSIGVVAKFETTLAPDNAEFAAFAKNIALQIGAYPTPYLCREEVPASVLEEEKNILLAQIANDPANAKKPDAIKEKMVMGRISKFYDNNCLVDMTYVKDEDLKVGQYVEKTAKELGGEIRIVKFYRFEKGEGIQKREEDFAEEIAKMTAGK